MKLQAPATLSRRAPIEIIQAETPEAIAFIDQIKAEALKVAMQNRRSNVPESYYEAAAAKLAIRHDIGSEGRSHVRGVRTLRFHTWQFHGTARSSWGHTVMVIRVNGTLNCEELVRQILIRAESVFDQEIRDAKITSVAAQIAHRQWPEGYTVKPLPNGVRVTFEGYERNVYLSSTVPPDRALDLIHAHQAWVVAYTAAKTC